MGDNFNHLNQSLKAVDSYGKFVVIDKDRDYLPLISDEVDLSQQGVNDNSSYLLPSIDGECSSTKVAADQLLAKVRRSS